MHRPSQVNHPRKAKKVPVRLYCMQYVSEFRRKKKAGLFTDHDPGRGSDQEVFENSRVESGGRVRTTIMENFWAIISSDNFCISEAPEIAA